MPKTIILCEAHHESMTRELVLNNLPFLIQSGYEAFGFEHDCDRTLEQEIASLENFFNNVDLQFNLLRYLPSLCQHFPEDISTPVLTAQSNLKLLALFKEIKKHRMIYSGLDANLGDRFSPTLRRSTLIDDAVARKDEREDKMTEQLLNLKNGIAIIGAAHIPGVQKRLVNKLGLTAAQNQFFFIVPHGELPNTQEIRRILFDLGSSKNYAALESLIPLKQLNMISIFPPLDAPHETIDIRFKQIISTTCNPTPSNDEETPSRCCSTLFHQLNNWWHQNEREYRYAATKRR